MYDIWNRLEKKGWFIGKIVPRWRRSAIKYSYWQCELIHDDGKSDASTSRHSIRKKGVEFNDADFRLGIWPGTCSASTFENCSTREAFLLRASRVYQSIWYSCLIHVIFWTKIWAELPIHSFSKYVLSTKENEKGQRTVNSQSSFLFSFEFMSHPFF